MRYILPDGTPTELLSDDPVVLTPEGPALRSDFTGRLDPRTLDLLVALGSDLTFAVRLCSLCSSVLGVKTCNGGITHTVCPDCMRVLYPQYAGRI
jgi:hypothetical protein